MKKKEKKYGLLKAALLLILFALVLTWLIPNGQYAETGFTQGVMRRVGLEDISEIIYNGMAFGLDKVILLLVMGGFYGVLSKIEAYDRVVNKLAEKFSAHKKLTAVILSVVIALLTSVLTQCFTVLIFIPFIVAILKRMDLDKLEIMAITFGSMLVGIMGATFGSEGLILFDKYLGGEASINAGSVWIRFGILAIGLVLFNFFALVHMDKKKENVEATEIFEIEEPKEEKKRSSIPLIVVFALLFILVILGYLNWSGYFNITIFDDFWTLLTQDIAIGNDFYIFKDILGRYMGAFGSWTLFSISIVMILFTGLLGLCYRVKFDDFLTNYINGIKKVLKPIACIFGAYTLMVVVYMSPYIATIMNKLLTLTDSFNIVTMTLVSLITAIFHIDLGYTGYIYGSFLVTEYADYINPLYTMFTSLYGLVQFFVPTSIVLGVGLTSLNVNYKDWLKYIWRFLVGMIIVLLIVFILMALV